VKILAREEGVDKRTIDYFFRAFNLNWIPVTIQSLTVTLRKLRVQPYHTPTFEVAVLYHFLGRLEEELA